VALSGPPTRAEVGFATALLELERSRCVSPILPLSAAPQPRGTARRETAAGDAGDGGHAFEPVPASPGHKVADRPVAYARAAVPARQRAL